MIVGPNIGHFEIMRVEHTLSKWLWLKPASVRIPCFDNNNNDNNDNNDEEEEEEVEDEEAVFSLIPGLPQEGHTT
jgi:hypothetical protein